MPLKRHPKTLKPGDKRRRVRTEAGADTAERFRAAEETRAALKRAGEHEAMLTHSLAVLDTLWVASTGDTDGDSSDGVLEDYDAIKGVSESIGKLARDIATHLGLAK